LYLVVTTLPTPSQASIIVADYALLRRDFHRQLGDRSDAQIDAWLLENAAFLSAGQARRLRVGGDHHTLLGIDALAGGVDEVLDASRRAAGIRNRSFGRAANLLANGGRYWCVRWRRRVCTVHAGSSVCAHFSKLICFSFQ
jgi:hypothetical protein